ncbi:lymphatic vessel endothelial hyaluronic acid receptor 1-like [Seriola lalandi dorsalis]|uniref:Lymphatic vessel endothelial hyaluronic acid receptor 1-like n=1 Tax=Seriola lalandi dorsalis TaxID=1841481 RepID=A0A3B4Z516_SERLL|nr:lymphatic vessel endothelial hyaluronic acid receptor 1-like [Seriola lalandi dorsalis]
MQNMARFSFFTQCLMFCLAALFPAAESSVIQVPQSPITAGVFMLIEGGKYTLNFTAARAACLFLNVTIATRDQMEQALQQGLETCKFGWIAEQIAVLPRLTPDNNCGKGKTGVVTWRASADKPFGVYCFSSSDLLHLLPSGTQTSTSPTTSTALTRSSTPTAALVTSTTTKAASSVKPITTKTPEKKASTTASTLLLKTTCSSRISSTSTSLKTFSTRIPTSLSHLIASKPTVVTAAFSTSVSLLPPHVSSAQPSLGAVPTALIIFGVILLLLTAAGAVWYYKLNIFTFWSAGQQKDDTETEMWKHNDSEMDLQQGAEEDDEYEVSDRKYSSDITLFVNPDMKTDYSE